MAGRKKSGSLLAIAALFAIGGALKIGMTATQAIALAPDLKLPRSEEHFVDYREEELKDLFEALAKREAYNTERAKELAEKEAMIEAKLETLEAKKVEALSLIGELEAENERLRPDNGSRRDGRRRRSGKADQGLRGDEAQRRRWSVRRDGSGVCGGFPWPDEGPVGCGDYGEPSLGQSLFD